MIDNRHRFVRQAILMYQVVGRRYRGLLAESLYKTRSLLSYFSFQKLYWMFLKIYYSL